MRLLVLSVSVSCAACLGATCAIAQDQTLPYGTHMDRRHGNDHVYPDRGAVLRDVPRGAAAVHYAGLSYRFAGGVWYERLGPAYMVVAPPLGLVVPQLPAFATRFDSAGKTYLYSNDAFYRPRPDLGGYEVVNDPEDVAVSATPPRVASVSASAPAPPAVPAPLTASDAPLPANPTGVAIHPHSGQSLDQQAMDRYECYRFAVRRTGFDPLATPSGKSPAQVARGDTEYSRAQAACLQGRGYTVE